MFLRKIKKHYVAANNIVLFHGGDIDNLKKLQKKVSILTPEQKLKLPSTGAGKIGLSTTTDKEIAKRYSLAFGHRKVLTLYLDSSAKIYPIDSKGKGIDEVISNDEMLNLKKQGYDAVSDSSHDEKEYRILNSGKIKVGDLS